MTTTPKKIPCPICSTTMEWSCYNENTPHIIGYECDKCNWWGEFDFVKNCFHIPTEEEEVFANEIGPIPMDYFVNFWKSLGGSVK